MKLHEIKTLWLRRTIMVAVLPFTVFEYTWIGLKIMGRGFRDLWNYRE